MGATFMYEPNGLKPLLRLLRPGLPVLVHRLPAPGHLLAELAQAVVASQFAEAGIPEADRRKITSENALRTFGLQG